MAIREKTLVKAIGGEYVGRQGRVSSVYPDVGIALVSFDDPIGLVKVSLSDLVEIRPQETEEPKTESKPVTKGEITIEYEEFKHIACKLAVKLCDGDFMFGLLLTSYAAALADRLFKCASEDVQ
jgi:hypothetical protein